MYDFNTHARQLADLEASVRDARQRNAQFPKPSMRVISVMVAILIAGTIVGAGMV